jgi:hypothetical protein
LPIALTSFNSLIFEFLDREYRGQPNAAKRLAQITKTSPRTAENWLLGLNAPSGDRLADLVAAHPDLEQAILSNFHARRACLHARSNAAAADSRARLTARAQ